MAVAYDTSLVYCLEADVERYGVYDWDASSSPTEDEVYDYAQDVAAAITVKTEQAGDIIIPADASGEPVRVSRLLEQANAVGAAMLARRAMYVKSGSQRDGEIWQALASQYDALMGEGASGGGTAAGVGDGGLIDDAVSSAANTGLLANEVTENEIALKGLDTRTDVEPEFTVLDVD